MEIGIDSFIASRMTPNATAGEQSDAIAEFLDRVAAADEVGLDVFGVGEHHRENFLDSAPTVILGAATARTKNIRLTSAVTVLSAVDPVRAFESFATLDLLSRGRAEMVVGRGSFTDAFPLFGLDLADYDDLFAENLELLLKLREKPHVMWSGRHRPALTGQGVYPRPIQDPFPIWLGVGGTPESFTRAGLIGMPLMVAIIGGETHRFAPLVDLYRRASVSSGHALEAQKVGLHSFGYVAATTEQAYAEFFPGYMRSMTRLAQDRGWPSPTRRDFDAQVGPTGAYVVGGPEEVAAKILRHSKALGGIARFTFQMDAAELPHKKLLQSTRLIGEAVAPIIRASIGRVDIQRGVALHANDAIRRHS